MFSSPNYIRNPFLKISALLTNASYIANINFSIALVPTLRLKKSKSLAFFILILNISYRELLVNSLREY
jgi:hypothetical protein